jgi:hypothetical protein
MERDPGESYRELMTELSPPSGCPHLLAALLALYLQGRHTYTTCLLW